MLVCDGCTEVEVFTIATKCEKNDNIVFLFCSSSINLFLSVGSTTPVHCVYFNNYVVIIIWSIEGPALACMAGTILLSLKMEEEIQIFTLKYTYYSMPIFR